MLVLSRRHGEAIRIHEQVTITVLGIRGNRVQLGIEAPAGVTIRRRELATAPGGPRAAADPADATADFPGSRGGLEAIPPQGCNTGAFSGATR
jgi:carbon storage regulator